AGGASPGRRRPGARLSRPAGVDRRALRARPAGRHAGRAPVSHRRPGAAPARRPARVPGPARHQVKVRGVRIELGEIGLALAAPAGCGGAGGAVGGGRGGARSLAAYFVAAAEPAPTAAALRAFLRGRLTEPMVPSSFTRLERLPLTPNGKVDRKALPAPED